MSIATNGQNKRVQLLPQSSLYWAIADTLVLTKRNLLNYARNLEAVLSATIQLFVLLCPDGGKTWWV